MVAALRLMVAAAKVKVLRAVIFGDTVNMSAPDPVLILSAPANPLPKLLTVTWSVPPPNVSVSEEAGFEKSIVRPLEADRRVTAAVPESAITAISG